MNEKQDLERNAKSPDLKTVRIEFRATSDEKRQLQARAKRAGKRSLGQYLIDAGLEKPLVEPLSPELRRHLVGIGTNLNQLARLANSGKAFQDFPKYESALRQTLDVLNRAVTGEAPAGNDGSQDQVR